MVTEIFPYTIYSRLIAAAIIRESFIEFGMRWKYQWDPHVFGIIGKDETSAVWIISLSYRGKVIVFQKFRQFSQSEDEAIIIILFSPNISCLKYVLGIYLEQLHATFQVNISIGLADMAVYVFLAICQRHLIAASPKFNQFVLSSQW